MIARLLSPIVTAALALVLALVLGPAWFYFRTDKLIGQIMAARSQQAAEKAEVVTERRAQGWDFWTIEMENLSSELKEEKKRLQVKSLELDQRAARIASDRQELDRIRYDLEGMRRQIDGKVIVIKADEAKNLRSLAQTYATLSAPGAVLIFKEMDDATVVKILSLMKAEVQGPILEEMSHTQLSDGTTMAKRAAVLSEKIRMMKVGVAPAGS